MFFSIFKELCNHSHYLILEHFIAPQRNFIPIKVILTFLPATPPFNSSWQPLIHLLILRLAYTRQFM